MPNSHRMPTHRDQLQLRLEHDVITEIRTRCEEEGIDPAPPRGKAGGPAEWVRRLIYRALGLGDPPDPHKVSGERRRKRA